MGSNMKYALVTGGAGFIGSNVVDLLINSGCVVTVVDNLSTGKKENVNPKAKFFELDLCKNKEEFDRKMSGEFDKFDVVFHLAALPRVDPSIQNPIEYNEANVTATLVVLDACRKNNILNVVFSSSSSVYGDAKTVPTSEIEPTNPMSPYALQKLICDQYAELFCKLYGMNVVSLRYFNVYGNREPTEGAYVPVIGIWFRQLSEGKPLTITGDGTQSRDFVNVLDVARANKMAADSILDGRCLGHVVFNVGSGRNVDLNTLSSFITGNVSYIPPRIEPKHTCADVDRIKMVLKWEPQNVVEVDIQNRLSGLTRNDD